MSDESDAVTPQCQTYDCDGDGTVLVRSKKTGLEIYQCDDCIENFHKQGWEKIRGDAELKP